MTARLERLISIKTKKIFNLIAIMKEVYKNSQSGKRNLAANFTSRQTKTREIQDNCIDVVQPQVRHYQQLSSKNELANS